jgi:hypothetical protein
MKNRIWLLLIIAFLVSSCAGGTSIRKNPSFNQEELHKNKIIVLPAECVISTWGVGGAKKRVDDYEYYIEGLLNQNIVAALREIGYNASFLSRKEIYDLKLSYDLLALQNSYNTAIKELYAKPYLPEQKAFVISNKVNATLPQLNSNDGKSFLLVANYSAEHASNGARVAALLFKVYGIVDKVELVLGIIDNQTGNIVWTNLEIKQGDAMYTAMRKIGTNNNKFDEQNISSILKEVLKPLKINNKKATN